VQPCWRLLILQQSRQNPGQFSTRTDLVAGHGAGDGAFCLPQRAGASLAFDGAVRPFSH
jgi:hypothetical protein